MSELERARESYGEARRALEVLLGRYPAAEIEVAAAYPILPVPGAAGAPASLLERRPDIVAAERAVLAAFRQEEAAELALLPNFSFSLIGGRLGDPVLSILHLNPWLASAAIGASIPIYEGGALRAQVKIATAQQAQAVARYGSVVLKAFREVENALANERLLAKRLPLGPECRRSPHRGGAHRHRAVQGGTQRPPVGLATSDRSDRQRSRSDQAHEFAAGEPRPAVSGARRQLRPGAGGDSAADRLVRTR